MYILASELIKSKFWKNPAGLARAQQSFSHLQDLNLHLKLPQYFLSRILNRSYQLVMLRYCKSESLHLLLRFLHPAPQSRDICSDTQVRT